MSTVKIVLEFVGRVEGFVMFGFFFFTERVLISLCSRSE